MKKYYCVRCSKKIGLLDRVIVDDKMIRLSNGKDTQVFKYREMKHYKCLTRLEQKSIELAKKRKKKNDDDDNDTNNKDYIYTDSS